MTNNSIFGSDYPNDAYTILKAKQRYELQRDQSAEGFSGTIDGTSESFVIQEHTNPLNKEKETKKLFCNIDSVVESGSIIEASSPINLGKFLVTSNVDNNQAYLKALIMKINTPLNWVNDSGKIISIEAVRQPASMTSVDTSENKYMTIVDGDLIIRTKSTVDTLSLSKRDGLRFIFSDEECYSLENVYKTLADGQVILKLKQSEINFETDKYVDLGNGNFGWIADYTKAPIYNLSIDQPDSQVIDGNTLQLSAQVTKDGQVVSEDVSWSSSDVNVATVDNTGLVTSVTTGSVVITATMVNNSSVTDIINIDIVAVANDNYSIQLTPDSTDITLTTTITVNATLLNNGIVQPDTFTFSVVGGTASASDYVFTSIDGNNYSIENKVDGGTVIVRSTSGIYSIDETYSLNYLF